MLGSQGDVDLLIPFNYIRALFNHSFHFAAVLSASFSTQHLETLLNLSAGYEIGRQSF
jgi:hypothetical protein